MTEPEVIVGCGQSKLDRPAPAHELYTGQYVKASLAWAKSVKAPDDYYILSAKYGLIRPQTVIEPYDTTFLPSAPLPMKADIIGIDLLRQQIKDAGLIGPVIVVAGKYYLQRLWVASKGTVIPVNPFQRMAQKEYGRGGMGWHMKLMVKNKGRIPDPKEYI